MENKYLSSLYIVIWSKGKNFPEDSHFDPANSKLKEHVSYIFNLYSKGLVFMGGPYADGSGALTIFNIQDENLMFDIIENNPACKNGVVAAESILWNPVDWKSQLDSVTSSLQNQQ